MNLQEKLTKQFRFKATLQSGKCNYHTFCKMATQSKERQAFRMVPVVIFYVVCYVVRTLPKTFSDA